MRSAGHVPGIHIQQYNPLMHLFPSETSLNLPERFTDPFRYSPHPLVRLAAELTTSRIKESDGLSSIFEEGKMLGVLVVSDNKGNTGYLSAFSGNVGGRSLIDGFVPPIFDLLDPSGHFKIKEAEITALNKSISEAADSPALHSLRQELNQARVIRDEEIERMKAAMAISRREREEIRQEVSDPSRLADLTRKSQFEKAELKRLKLSWVERIESLQQNIRFREDDIMTMKSRRAEMSDKLQKWIFSQYLVHNALGESSSIGEIFSSQGLIPPGGTGECAAPKLLEYAYRNGLKPLAMGEFWYGTSPETAVRTEGHFYPSCTSKCGPLLGYMLKGLSLEREPHTTTGHPETLFEDDSILIVSKPSGMPSVPGLDGRESLSEWLTSKCGINIFPVHRLDMDTSGIMVFAKDQPTCTALQRQFELHTISKTYMARLSPAAEGSHLNEGDNGRIELPLNADYDERPRQKIDKQQGKEALTIYKVISVNEDESIDIVFHPHTGRTHQLRVHSAHMLGLGHPIIGDLLYGGSPSSRLHLHAFEISFTHPSSRERMTFSTTSNCFD